MTFGEWVRHHYPSDDASSFSDLESLDDSDHFSELSGFSEYFECEEHLPRLCDGSSEAGKLEEHLDQRSLEAAAPSSSCESAISTDDVLYPSTSERAGSYVSTDEIEFPEDVSPLSGCYTVIENIDEQSHQRVLELTAITGRGGDIISTDATLSPSTPGPAEVYVFPGGAEAPECMSIRGQSEQDDTNRNLPPLDLNKIMTNDHLGHLFTSCISLGSMITEHINQLLTRKYDRPSSAILPILCNTSDATTSLFSAENALLELMHFTENIDITFAEMLASFQRHADNDRKARLRCRQEVLDLTSEPGNLLLPPLFEGTQSQHHL
ncbi:MAG: hypothetical protein Q9222_003345 [Ikaeria aurantiellina]